MTYRDFDEDEFEQLKRENEDFKKNKYSSSSNNLEEYEDVVPGMGNTQ